MTILLFLALISIIRLSLSIHIRNNPRAEKKLMGISMITSILYYSLSIYIIIKYAPIFWDVIKTFYSIL